MRMMPLVKIVLLLVCAGMAAIALTHAQVPITAQSSMDTAQFQMNVEICNTQWGNVKVQALMAAKLGKNTAHGYEVEYKLADKAEHVQFDELMHLYFPDPASFATYHRLCDGDAVKQSMDQLDALKTSGDWKN